MLRHAKVGTHEAHLIETLQARFDALEIVLRWHQVGLVEKKTVRKRNLRSDDGAFIGALTSLNPKVTGSMARTGIGTEQGRKEGSQPATCSIASFSTPSSLTSSRCCSMCLASTSVTMPSRRANCCGKWEGQAWDRAQECAAGSRCGVG